MKQIFKNWFVVIGVWLGILACILAAVLIGMAQESSQPSGSSKQQSLFVKGICPKTQVVGDAGDCFRCHVPVTFKLKEADPCDGLIMPGADVRARCKDGKVESITWFVSINSNEAERIFSWAGERNIRYLIFEIQSPGGSLFEAWRIVGMMQEFQKQGGVIETRCYGFAASAGFLILASGSKGYRYASSTSHLMWHELMSLSLFRIDTPSSSEETSKILRKLQNIANTWLSTVSKMSKDEIDQMVKNKEFWMTGEEALQKGFIDKLLN